MRKHIASGYKRGKIGETTNQHRVKGDKFAFLTYF